MCKIIETGRETRESWRKTEMDGMKDKNFFRRLKLPLERREGRDMMCRRFRLAGEDYFIGGGVGDGRGVKGRRECE